MPPKGKKFLKPGTFVVVYLHDHALVVGGHDTSLKIKLPGYVVEDKEDTIKLSTWTPMDDADRLENADCYTIVKHKDLKIKKAKEI